MLAGDMKAVTGERKLPGDESLIKGLHDKIMRCITAAATAEVGLDANDINETRRELGRIAANVPRIHHSCRASAWSFHARCPSTAGCM